MSPSNMAVNECLKSTYIQEKPMIGANFPHAYIVLYIVAIIFGTPAIAYALTVLRRLPPKSLTLRVRGSTRCRVPPLSDLDHFADGREAA